MAKKKASESSAQSKLTPARILSQTIAEFKDSPMRTLGSATTFVGGMLTAITAVGAAIYFAFGAMSSAMGGPVAAFFLLSYSWILAWTLWDTISLNKARNKRIEPNPRLISRVVMNSIYLSALTTTFLFMYVILIISKRLANKVDIPEPAPIWPYLPSIKGYVGEFSLPFLAGFMLAGCFVLCYSAMAVFREIRILFDRMNAFVYWATAQSRAEEEAERALSLEAKKPPTAGGSEN